jgi:hypothetical protein
MNESPYDLHSLLSAVEASEADVAAFFASINDVDFVRRPGEAWSPAEHLDHLNIAVSATARGLGLRPWLLRLRFGSSQRASRTYDELRAAYQRVLAGGGRASGRFLPEIPRVENVSAASRKAELLARWTRVNERLRTALGGWSERNLDRVQLPHPLLGMITARELAFFTIYHGPHHLAAAKRRLG